MSQSPSPTEMRISALASRPILRYARIAVELTSPLHVGTGSEDGDSDAGIVLDANGLVSIPGSSIKGALRHAYHQLQSVQTGLPTADEIFGHCLQEGHASGGKGGRLSVTWGRVHDRNNLPVDRPLKRSEIIEDPVLRIASEPSLRDHVRLDHRGTALRYGKFDERYATPGLRFTFAIEFRGGLDETGDVNQGDADAWDAVLTLFQDPLFRFGGKNRRGYGAFRIISHQHRTFRLDGGSSSPDPWNAETEWVPADEWKGFVELPQRLSDPLPDLPDNPFWDDNWLNSEVVPKPLRAAEHIQVKITPDDCFWMIGGAESDTTSDSAPMSIKRVKWRDERGFAEQVWLVPGSSIKGALRHRAAFHFRRLSKQWADGGLPEEITDPKAIDDLFGYVKLNKTGGRRMVAPDEIALPGLVFIDDVLAPTGAKQAPIQNHVSIDRILGGAMDHLLFDDEPLEGGVIEFSVWLANPESITPQARQALALALDDLCHGRLSLGAHAGRGYGYFKGNFQIVQPSRTADNHE